MWIWYNPKIPAERKIALKIDVLSNNKLKITPLKRSSSQSNVKGYITNREYRSMRLIVTINESEDTSCICFLLAMLIIPSAIRIKDIIPPNKYTISI